MIIYFSKVNLSTVKLFDLYKQDKVRKEIRDNIFSFFESGTIYEVENYYKDDNGEKHPITTRYKLSIGIKDESSISGVIYKYTTIYYKELNELNGEIETRSQKTIEDIKFYFDVERELVGFHTRQRFGYQDFNSAFAGIINMCMEKNKSDLEFSVELYNEGMEIDEISEELKKISNIKRLEFMFKIPNPSDDDLLKELKDRLTDTAEQLEKANANSMSVIFDSSGGIGLNIEAEEIKMNLSRIGRITSGVSDALATKNGYARVKATGKDGKIYTTEDQKPIKCQIEDDEDDITFFRSCKDTILNIFAKKIITSQKKTE